MGVSPAGADPVVSQPPPPPPEPAPVAANGGVGPASGPASPAAPSAPASAPAPVDTFEGAPAPRPAATPPAQPASRYGAAGPEIEKQLDKNGDEFRAAYANKVDPTKSFFEAATKAQERTDLLGKVLDKTPDGSRKTRLTGERDLFDSIARSNFAEFQRDERRQIQLKALPPEQQKSFQAGYERFQKEEKQRAEEKAKQPVDPAEQRKEELQRTTASAPLKLLNLSTESHANPAKALDYSKVWNEADAARRELGEGPAPKAWYDAKRDVLDDALRKPGIGDDLRQKLEDERDVTDAADAKDRIKELDQEIADINSGKKIGDPALRERLKGTYQDRIDKVEGKPPSAAYQTEKKQLDERRADVDRRIAELKAKEAPKGAPGNGSSAGTGDGAASGTGTGTGAAEPPRPSLAMKALEKEKAEIAAKSGQLDANHRDNLKDFAQRQADRATAAPRKQLDGLEKQRADLDRQLAGKDLDPGKRAELEKQRAAVDGDATKLKGDIKQAEQKALEQARAQAKKDGNAEGLWKQGDALGKEAGDYQDRVGLPAMRLEVDKAKDAQQTTERLLDLAKKDQKLFGQGRLSREVNGKPVPSKQFGAELDAKVDGYEKDLAANKARTTRAQANVAGAEVEQRRLEAEQQIKYAQSVAAELGTQRLGEPPVGRTGLPADVESGLLSKDPEVQKAAADKAATWFQDRLPADKRAELKELGKKFGFEPHDSKDLYFRAKNAEKADQALQAAKGEATRTAADADKAAEEAKARGVALPPPATPVPPDKVMLNGVKPAEKTAPPADAPAPAGAQAKQQPKVPEKERDPINVALSPEDRAHLERQGKEILEEADKWKKRLAPAAEALAKDAGPSGPPPAQPKGPPGSGEEPAGKDKGSDPLKDAAHDLLKKALQDPDIVHRLMQGERIGYGLFSQAAGLVGGLYDLGAMGAKGIANIAKDPEAAADKAWKGIKYAAENPDKVLKDAWNGGVKIAKHLKDEIVKSAEKDPLEFAGRAAFEALTFWLGAGEANAASKGLKAADAGVDALRAAEKGAEVIRGAEKGVEVAKAVDKTADAVKAAEKGTDTLRPGTQAYDDLRRTVEAKEQTARRMRDVLEGRSDNSIVPKGARSMNGSAGMKPEQIRAEIASLEKAATEGRQALEAANKAARGTVADIEAAAVKDAAKFTPEEFSKNVMGYPEDLSKKFTNGEIESTRVYLGNEVRGNPLDKKAKFPQSELHDALDDAAKGYVDPKGNVVPPGDTGRINFQHINGHLRGTKKDLTPGQVDRANMVAGHMDTMMDKSKLAESTTVYRVNKLAPYTTPDAKGLLPADKGFMSTGRTPQLGFTVDAEQAKKSVLQIIDLPKGQRAVDMDALTRYYGDLDSFRGRMPHGVEGKTPFGENELLLPRGTQLQVVDQWVDPKTGLTVQRCRVVPGGK